MKEWVSEKLVIQFFWTLFSQESKLFTTKDWFDIDIYDLPTQFFVYDETKKPIYSMMPEQIQQVINKIIKDAGFDTLEYTKITLEDITIFRRTFWKHPEIVDLMDDLIKEWWFVSELESLNLFFNEMVRLKIYDDEHLSKLREFRIYIAKKSIWYEWRVSEDMKSDLYYFLEFDRFKLDSYVRDMADRVLNKICQMITDGDCPDVRQFRSFNDWDKIPMEIVSMIEKLVLVNYCDKPDKNVVNEIRIAVEEINLDILKDYLWFKPRWWQVYAIIFESRENFAICCRRAWKTFLIIYICIRQLFLPWQMILYILPSKEDYSEQPFFYIEQMLENIKKRGAELPWFQFNSKQFRVINKLLKSKIIFISAQWSSKGKSFSANLIAIDEAGMIDNGNIYDQAYNSTKDTLGRMWGITTINVDTPINRVFYKKVALEWMDDCKVHTVDIYNNPFISQEERERTERQYKDRNQAVWLSDWMAIFVWGVEWFDTSRFFQIDFIYDVLTFKWFKFNLARNIDNYSKLILAYDPAKTLDKAGLALLWLKWKTADVIMTWYIDIKNYFIQREVIVEMLEYLNKIKQCEFVVDLGKAWEAAFDYFESRKLAPYWILSTWWQTINKQTYRRWNTPEPLLEKNLHSLMAAWVIRGFSWLEHIRNEFETYNLAKERKWAVWHHHDVLSALMIAATVRYERWLISFEIKKWEEHKETVVRDARWRPIKSLKPWGFNPNVLWRFIH